ncbi:MAG: hypothetical protein IJZ34_16050 [Lachnospiraceae bacterium]|nr:hypothetical protein [Lachnospiraceae bacterium]
MKKLKKILITCTFIMSIFCFCCIPVKADTDGTELNILEPSKLEIQLGQDWSGVQFQLKTDVGLYPEEITVGEDGVLRLEIGGSSTYILICLNSEVAAPSPDQTDSTPVLEDSDDAETDPSESETAEESVTEDAATTNGNTGTVAGIPIMHLLLFCGGLLISVGTLIAIRVISNKKRDVYEYDDDEEDE